MSENRWSLRMAGPMERRLRWLPENVAAAVLEHRDQPHQADDDL